MSVTFPQKYPTKGTTIFSVMTALAQEYNAINLSQGFPDFAIDEHLIQFVNHAVSQGFNQYAPMTGLPLLRQRISEKTAFFQHVTVDAMNEVTITPGATYAIYTALASILQQGDEVIVLEPAYDSYVPNIYMHQAIPVCIALNDKDFSVNWERVFEAVTSRTKAIIINNPHNPCGVTWSESDFVQLQNLVQRFGIYIISDEVYEHLIYDQSEHLSVLRFPELRAKSFAIFSFGKSLHATGWKIGYCIAPPELTNAFRQIHQYLAFSVNTPMQQAIAQYLENFEHLSQTKNLLQQKRDLFLSLMQQTPFSFAQPAQGSYFQTMSYKGLSHLPDKEFAIWLTQQYGVATIPLSAFYQHEHQQQLVRFCFAKSEATLRVAAERLQNIF